MVPRASGSRYSCDYSDYTDETDETDEADRACGAKPTVDCGVAASSVSVPSM